jgi:hypothetical protein
MHAFARISGDDVGHASDDCGSDDFGNCPLTRGCCLSDCTPDRALDPALHYALGHTPGHTLLDRTLDDCTLHSALYHAPPDCLLNYTALGRCTKGFLLLFLFLLGHEYSSREVWDDCKCWLEDPHYGAFEQDAARRAGSE